jgi:indolepyruvate ferredoxin oxidoreductase beta subunit
MWSVHPNMSKRSNKNLNIVIAGVAGQGTLFLTRIIAKAAFFQGLDVKFCKIFGASQRGGPVLTHLRIGSQLCARIPRRRADIILGLELLEGVKACINYIKDTGIVILNKSKITPVNLVSGKERYPSEDYLLSLIKKFTSKIHIFSYSPFSVNTYILGIFANYEICPILNKNFIKAIKSEKNCIVNLKRFKQGYKLFSS